MYKLYSICYICSYTNIIQYIYIRINIYLFKDVQCLLVASFLVLWNEWVNHCVNTFALGVQDVVISLSWSTEGEAQLFLS